MLQAYVVMISGASSFASQGWIAPTAITAALAAVIVFRSEIVSLLPQRTS